MLSLASIANTCEFGFDENNLALFPTPVPASRIVEHVFKKLLNFGDVFQPNLSKNHFFCPSIHFLL